MQPMHHLRSDSEGTLHALETRLRELDTLLEHRPDPGLDRLREKLGQVVGQYIKRDKERSFLVFTVCPCCAHPVSEARDDMKRGGRKPKKRTRSKRVKAEQAPAEPTPTEPKETP